MSNKSEEISLETSLDAVDVFADWDRLLQTPFNNEDDPLSDMVLEEDGQAYWEALFNSMNFPGMDLMAVVYFPKENEDLLGQHKTLCRTIRDFIRFLSYNYANDLRSAGISEEGIFYMKKGQLPENFTVHLKYPLNYGGSIDFNNMVLIQSTPFHELIHHYINRQLIGPEGVLTPRQLYVPVPTGKVYVPTGLFTGSGGKNKQDRSVLAGYSQSALRDIAMKSMPGR